jgi:hypothetical protein
MRQANRRYLNRFIPSMTCYAVLLIASNKVEAAYAPTGAPLIALAILPALPIIAVIWAMGMAIVEQPDEYVRAKLIHAMLIATALMLSVMTAWSFLEDTGVVPHKPVHLTFPLWCAGLLLGQIWLWARDRIAGREA